MKRFLLLSLVMSFNVSCVVTPVSTETPSQVKYVAEMNILPGFEGVSKENIEAAVDRDIATEAEFFGKVVNENNEPMPDLPVKVVSLNRKLEPFVPPYYGWTFLTDIKTNSKGEFSIRKHNTAALSIAIELDGFWDEESYERSYYYSERLTFKNEYQIPESPETPEIFRLIKKPASASVEKVSTGSIFLDTGRSVGVDLSQPRYSAKEEKSDLLIEYMKSDSENERYAWEITLSVPNGGIQKVRDTRRRNAPAEGYQDLITVGVPKNSDNWDHRDDWWFYVITGDNNYAEINVKVRTRYQAYVVIEGVINKNQSRIFR